MSQPEHDPTSTVLIDVALSATCPLPGCDTLVTDPTQPCQGCLAAFGDLLRRVDTDQTSDQITAELAARDTAVADMYRRRRELVAGSHTGDPDAARLARMETRLIAQIPAIDGDRKPNQACWLCEEPHTCTRTPQGYECDTCRDVR